MTDRTAGKRDPERDPSVGPLVLLVDDDADLLELAEIVLEGHGVRVLTASNGRRALRVLESATPDVIVTDLMMPELDGLSFLAEYSRRPPPRAPVVAVSGFAPYLEKAAQLGAAATLAKPYSPRQLVDVVTAITGGRPPPATPPPPAPDERARLQAVLELRLDETARELELERFLDEVAAIFCVPIAGISAVTADRQRLVAHCSSEQPDPGGPRAHSFCTHAVAARAALVIQDARENPFFRDNPSVTERGFRFYAGVPLMSLRGEAVGTLCILDQQPHRFTYLDLELLGLLARRVHAAFELRDRRTRGELPDGAYRHLHCLDEQLGIYGKALFADLVVVEASRALAEEVPSALVAVAAAPDRLAQVAAALRSAVVGGLVGRIGADRLAAVARGKTAAQAADLVGRFAGDALAIVATDLDEYEGATGRALHEVEQALG